MQAISSHRLVRTGAFVRLRIMRFIIQVVVVTFFAGVLGCSEDERSRKTSTSEKMQLDPRLKKIDPQIAFLEIMLSAKGSAVCTVSQTMSNLRRETDKSADQRDPAAAILSKIVNEKIGLCKVYERAQEESKAVFDEIRRQNHLLDKHYVFSLFLRSTDANDDGFEEEQIGVFESLESCRRVEELARQYRIPTRACRLWQGAMDFAY
jgi:hypothetical protein